MSLRADQGLAGDIWDEGATSHPSAEEQVGEACCAQLFGDSTCGHGDSWTGDQGQGSVTCFKNADMFCFYVIKIQAKKITSSRCHSAGLRLQSAWPRGSPHPLHHLCDSGTQSRGAGREGRARAPRALITHQRRAQVAWVPGPTEHVLLLLTAFNRRIFWLVRDCQFQRLPMGGCKSIIRVREASRSRPCTVPMGWDLLNTFHL